VRGCTFYNNSTANQGGAIYFYSGTLTLTGNLFYGNTANSYPVVYRYEGTVSSRGYNVVDVALGTGSAQSGFASAAGDKTVSALMVTAVSFRLLPGSGAAGVITTLPANYPAKDFYGDDIVVVADTVAAASGAVQSTAEGYYLALSVNYSTAGTVSTNPAANADGLYSGTVTITANPAAGFTVEWLVDGTNAGNDNTLELTLTDHTVVQAVFQREVVVNTLTDEAGSATSRTLRYALNNQRDGDIIRLDGVTAGETVIALGSALPNITRSIVIEGNGVTINGNSQRQLMNITGGASTIRRVWFKNGRATNGGAIYTNGTLNVKGCTFYNNSAGATSGQGGAIHKANTYGTPNITGNLFYGNTASGYPAVYSNGNSVISRGYNVVDVTLGNSNATQSGFLSVTGDRTYTYNPFSDTDTLAPVSGIIVIPASFAANMPVTDFYGEEREWPGASGAVR
jgi:predicted outer membrane repeat protein